MSNDKERNQEEVNLFEAGMVHKGEYRDYQYYVKKVGEGWARQTWLCGYVTVPGDKDFVEFVDDEKDNLEVHGGVTFFDYIEGYGQLIGFDCAHCGDSIAVQDTHYVVDMCKALIGQLILLRRQFNNERGGKLNEQK